MLDTCDNLGKNNYCNLICSLILYILTNKAGEETRRIEKYLPPDILARIITLFFIEYKRNKGIEQRNYVVPSLSHPLSFTNRETNTCKDNNPQHFYYRALFEEHTEGNCFY